MDNVVYCQPAMLHFGKVVSEALGWQLFVDCPVPPCDVVYIIGMYDPPNYDKTLRHTKQAKKRIIQWCGSDTFYADLEYLPEATHLSSGDVYSRRLLANTGIEAQLVYLPVSWQHEVTPLPEKPAIAAYIGNPAVKYGSEYVEALMEVMPNVDFYTYTLNTYQPWELRNLMERVTVQLQLGETSGGCSLREAMQAGRIAISNGIEYPYCQNFDPLDFNGLVRKVRNALKATEPDYEAAAYWHAQNDLDLFREIIEEVAR